jgi:ParB/RepB/Spo0J family partition protein
MNTLRRELVYVAPNTISFDQNNPRGLTEKQIVSKPHFAILVSSIKKYGILEPLIVKKDEANTSAHILIDGERRLRAALVCNQTEVPVLIADDDTDGRILAYQVHMLREDWNKAAETKAVKKIINDLKDENPNITDEEINKKVSEITAHKQHDLADILKLIKYDDKIIEAAVSKELNMSYLVQIESSFINPLKKHYLGIYSKYGEDEIRRILIEKAINGNLVNTRFLMDKYKVVFSDLEKKEKIGKILTNFLDKKKQSIKESLKNYEALSKPTKRKEEKIEKKVTSRKSKEIKSKDDGTSDKFAYKKIKITKKQQTSLTDIRINFENIGSSFSKEEDAYIAEALFCLERHCFKASTLMIWCAGISRILDYINDDIPAYNKASTDMAANPRSLYKHLSKNFQKTATSLDEIRLNCNDRQLLSYLLYKKIITETQFKKLVSDYGTRCDCAHPTDIEISPNQAISIFENVYNLIFNNGNLK